MYLIKTIKHDPASTVTELSIPVKLHHLFKVKYYMLAWSLHGYMNQELY